MYIFLDENRLNVNTMVAGFSPTRGNDNIYLHFLTLVNKLLLSSHFSKILTSISSHIRKEINKKWLLITLVAHIIRYVGTLVYFGLFLHALVVRLIVIQFGTWIVFDTRTVVGYFFPLKKLDVFLWVNVLFIYSNLSRQLHRHDSRCDNY